MKKALTALTVAAGLFLIPASLFAQENPRADWQGRYHKGDLTLEGGLGFGSHGEGNGYGVAFAPGAEWTLQDWKVGGRVPLAFGVAAKGFVELVPGEGVGFGAGGFATLHLGMLRAGFSDFLRKIDFVLGLGGGALVLPWDDPTFGLALPAIFGGASYFFKDNLAVYLEGVWWHGWEVAGFGGAVVGIRMRR
jgi:hypothetical protein